MKKDERKRYERIRASGKKQFSHDLQLRLIKLLNAAGMTGIFAYIWYQFYRLHLYSKEFYSRGNLLIAMLFFIIFYMFGRIYDAFQVSLHRVSEMIYSQGLAAGLADAVMLIVTWLLMRHFPNLWPTILILALQIVWAVIWSVCAHKWYFFRFRPKKTMIIYDMREGMEELVSQYGMETKFDVQETVQVEDALKRGLHILNGYEAVYLSGIHSHDRNIILKYCIAHNITVFVIPRIGDVIMSGAKQMHMFHLPMLRVDRYKPNPEYALAKRFMDILLSGLALVILSPVMAVVAIMIRKDGGPAFYKQVRLTKDGREFKVLKFRSMRVDAEKDGVARLSTGDKDDRITPVGHFIRKVRLDELPQLINILKGDMSIVGPRPERPEIARQYEEELPEFGLRLQVRAGLTGMAQVYGKYNTMPYDKLMLDLMYIAHPSLIEDLRIILATVKILFLPESTEGVEEGQETAAQKNRYRKI